MHYVMADIHGNLRRFRSVMEQIALTEEDRLYVLGDVIDRYPDGIEILRELMGMENAELILGNHEYMMLLALDRKYDPGNPAHRAEQERALNHWYRNGGRVTHEALMRLSEEDRREIFDYLKGLALNLELTVDGTHYRMVHGGPVEEFRDQVERYRDECYFAVWKRWKKDEFTPKDYVMVFGHTPTMYYQNDNPMRVWFGPNQIGVDCGSGFPEKQDPEEPYDGNLACIRLEDRRVFYSKEPGEEES